VRLIEEGAPQARMEETIAQAARSLRGLLGAELPDAIVLGCTHFPLVLPLFERELEPLRRIVRQPRQVALALRDYLVRHPRYADDDEGVASPLLLTTGDPKDVSRRASLLIGRPMAFRPAPV